MKTFQYTTNNRTLLADLHTPVSLYLKLRDLYPQSVLMESADFHAGENSRSFIGLCPLASIGINAGVARLTFPDGKVERLPVDKYTSPATLVQMFLSYFRVKGEHADFFGLYGYTAFDAVHYLEPSVPVSGQAHAENDAPELLYVFYKYIVCLNPFKSELTLTELLTPGEVSGLARLEEVMSSRNFATYDFRTTGVLHSTLTDDEHRMNIARGINHCLRGDVFQVVLSRRFIIPFAGDDFAVYRALRNINPSPYLFYFDFGGFRIFGSSPETHCRVQAGEVFIDPIAGTTRRTGDAAEDKALAEVLLTDAKEGAEHVMLVDLARNDLSRNCREVQVIFFKEAQFYSHVIHLVSRVKGVLNATSSGVKALMDTFPAGTLSGAPKVRAMQLINEIEPHNRGIYGGCVGFIGLEGDLNQAIAIRTFVSRAGELWLQAGGGITAQSKPEAELQEVNNKLAALRKAVEMAEKRTKND